MVFIEMYVNESQCDNNVKGNGDMEVVAYSQSEKLSGWLILFYQSNLQYLTIYLLGKVGGGALCMLPWAVEWKMEYKNMVQMNGIHYLRNLLQNHDELFKISSSTGRNASKITAQSLEMSMQCPLTGPLFENIFLN